MNLKNIFTSKPPAEQSPAIKAMAARVATLDGCEKLMAEFDTKKKEFEAARRNSAFGEHSADVAEQVRSLTEKRVELGRVTLRRRIESDLLRLDRDNKIEIDTASKRIQAMSDGLEAAEKRLTETRNKIGEVSQRIARTDEDLQKAKKVAGEAVAQAEIELRSLLEHDEQDAAREANAVQAVQRAKVAKDEAGSDLSLLLSGLRERLKHLEDLEREAVSERQKAERDLSLARIHLFEIRSDLAVWVVLQAAVNARAELSKSWSVLPNSQIDRVLSSIKRMTSPVVFGAHRLPAGAQLVNGEEFSGFDEVAAAMNAEPNLALLAGVPLSPVEDPAAEPSPTGLQRAPG